MKYRLLIFALLFTQPLFSQTNSTDLIKGYVQADLKTKSADVQLIEKKLEKSLSTFIADRVTQKSKPFYVNTSDLRKNIAVQKGKSTPQLNLLLQVFNQPGASVIVINNIKTVNGREILRGKIKNQPKSSVKLILHDNSFSGRIRTLGSEKVTLIQGTDDGVSVMYEINTTNLQYY